MGEKYTKLDANVITIGDIDAHSESGGGLIDGGTGNIGGEGNFEWD